ncbi:hypothetical protein MTO96_031169, partial [Rhipicephalus appendiculatus]
RFGSDLIASCSSKRYNDRSCEKKHSPVMATAGTSSKRSASESSTSTGSEQSASEPQELASAAVASTAATTLLEEELAPAGEGAEAAVAAAVVFQSDYDTKHVRTKYDFKNNETPKSINYTKYDPETYAKPKSINYTKYDHHNINKYQFSDTALQGTVLFLKELKAFVDKELYRDDVFSLVGIYISGTDTRDTLTKTFSALGAPDVVIGLGHLDYITANSTDCEMLPPSTYNNTKKSQQLRAKYGSLYELPAKIADMANVMQGIRWTVWAVASTLSARVYEPSEPRTKYELYDRCNRKDPIDQYDTPIKGCNGVNSFEVNTNNIPFPFLPLPGFEGARIYNGITFKYYAFDYADSLVRKYCKAYIDLDGTKFGLAAYDVNYDNGASSELLCDPSTTKIGNFSRVDIMRKMRDGFRGQHFVDVDECITAFAP